MKINLPTAARIELLLESGDKESMIPAFYQLRGLVLRKGCRVKLDLGWKQVTVYVSDIKPDKAPDYIIDTRTEISVIVSSHPRKESRLESKMKNIGDVRALLPGLMPAFEALQELIVYPLFYRNLVSRLGIKCPRGVLLHGPPGYSLYLIVQGCGKTMIISTLCSYFNLGFIKIDGPEIFSADFGESEARLVQKFKDANELAEDSDNGCILFIDEIDALAPSRDSLQSQNQESRVVAQLLTLMDGLEGRSDRLIVVAGLYLCI
jgi:SpoVK/Ycf46/Vps4 family AAA+-type ATPase